MLTNKQAASMLNMIEVSEYGDLQIHSWWGSFKKDMEEAIALATKALQSDSSADQSNIPFSRIPATNWISVNDRLPESLQTVLLFYESRWCQYVNEKIVAQGINYFVTTAFYDVEDKEWHEDTEWSRHSDAISYPLAWMPLPELYISSEVSEKEV